MKKLKNNIEFISAILGILSFLYSIFCLKEIKSNILPFILGIILSFFCYIIALYIKKIPKYTEFDGLKIDEAVNIPIFTSKKNQLNPINIIHTCEIFDSDAILEYEYFGICCDKKGCEKFSTSLHSLDVNDISNMEWFAYDLINDPNKVEKKNLH